MTVDEDEKANNQIVSFSKGSDQNGDRVSTKDENCHISIMWLNRCFSKIWQIWDSVFVWWGLIKETLYRPATRFQRVSLNLWFENYILDLKLFILCESHSHLSEYLRDSHPLKWNGNGMHKFEYVHEVAHIWNLIFKFDNKKYQIKWSVA